MKLVILESPYAGNISRNKTYARACVRDSLSRNESPIASHLLFTQRGILNDSVEAERDNGIEAGIAWCRVAEMCVVYTDHGISSGMKRGIERAQRHGVPVQYRRLGK